MKTFILITVLAVGLTLSAVASERYFTYSYEPETMPAKAWEFEQLLTYRTQRSATAGQSGYHRWFVQEELEYGVTDNYTAALYLNALQATTYKDTGTGASVSDVEFKGVSIENKYMVLNPAENPVGLALYLEPSYDGEEFELEQKIILGQRHGDWKWVVNLTHETEWDLEHGCTEGIFAVSAGLTRHLTPRWSLGLEVLNHNVVPSYRVWEYTALFAGPVITYACDKWWAALTVLPQVWGTHTTGGPDPDGVGGLELSDHERLNVRLIVGFGF